MGIEAWQATVCGVAKNGTPLKRLSTYKHKEINSNQSNGKTQS